VGPSVSSRIGVVSLLIAAFAFAPRSAAAVTFDGDIAYTSDYVFRGISETAGRSAGQIDLHLTTGDGTFVGAFASTLGHVWHTSYEDFGWDYELEEYLGHRFDLSPSWSATVTAVNYSYLAGNAPLSNDYQELSAAVSYLDSWTVTVGAIPNAVRYDRGHRLGRYPAYTLDASAQLPLVGRLLATAGAGYYASDNTGYAYGNAGLAFEFKSLRLDAGYYIAQDRARTLFPYGRAGSRFAGSVSWHF
jgi:uncharacterized protein (TIGR02001 family)